MSEEDLIALIDRKERAEREGREYRPTETEMRELEAAHRTAAEL